jgi:hypothetical protein
MQTLGNNVRTNFEAGEIRSLADIAQQIDTDKIVSLPLLDESKGVALVRNTSIGGASVVVPTAGTFDYSDIHSYLKSAMSSNPAVREGAVIDVLNGSEIEGLASRKADELKSEGYQIGQITNAQAGQYLAAQVYQLTTDKPATATALKERFDVELLDSLPHHHVTDADFVIIFGSE